MDDAAAKSPHLAVFFPCLKMRLSDLTTDNGVQTSTDHVQNLLQHNLGDKGLYIFLNTPTWETKSLGEKEEVNCNAFPGKRALRKAEVPHLNHRPPTFGSAPFFFPTPKFNMVLKLQNNKTFRMS